VTLAAGAMVVIGLLGIVVLVLPGLVLVWAGVALWAVTRGDTAAWITLGVASVLLLVGSLTKYLLPGRNLRASGVPWRTLALGALLGVAGFFVLPVVGLPLGFLLGVYLSEHLRLHTSSAAWASTRTALAAVGWSLVIELLTGLLIAGVWVLALVISPAH
jgi:uncharacterized protein YqgC (DUF456 family)